MGDMVIVAYRAKPGCEARLTELLADHVPHLRRLGLATERPALAMRNRDGVFVEVFEWEEGAVAMAHEHPDVQKLWAEYAELCDYVPLRELPEAADMFAHFEPVDLPSHASGTSA